MVFDNAQFTMVYSKTLRIEFGIDGISVNTLKKYFRLLKQRVISKISSELGDYFSIQFDDWANGFGTLFEAIYASKPTDGLSVKSFLLYFSPLSKRTNQKSINHINTIIDCLKIYNKTIGSIICITADNCNTNFSIAKGIHIPFMGCVIHKFQIFVRTILNDIDNKYLIEKANNLMVKFKDCNNLIGQLKVCKALKPKIKNATRWSSIFNMLERYIELLPIILKIVKFGIDEYVKSHPNKINPILFSEVDDLSLTIDLVKLRQRINSDPISLSMIKQLTELLPTSEELITIKTLFKTIKELNLVTKKLQASDLNFNIANSILNTVIQIYPTSKNYLITRPDIENNNLNLNFENAIRKVYNHKEQELTIDEKNTINKCIKPIINDINDNNDNNNVNNVNNEEMTFENLINNSIKSANTIENQSISKLKYDSFNFVPPTTVKCESLFSIARRIQLYFRSQLSDESVEFLLFLRENSHMWDISDIDAITVRKRKRTNNNNALVVDVDEELDSDDDTDEDLIEYTDNLNDFYEIRMDNLILGEEEYINYNNNNRNEL